MAVTITYDKKLAMSLFLHIRVSGLLISAIWCQYPQVAQIKIIFSIWILQPCGLR